MLIEPPLLITGGGPAALVVARIASSQSLASIIAGHVSTNIVEPEALNAESVEALGDSLGVLRPYLTATEPPTIAPQVFEHVLKHHCVADMNVTVYDGMEFMDSEADDDGVGVRGVLVDKRSRFDVAADAYVDADNMPTGLNAAIAAATDALSRILGTIV